MEFIAEIGQAHEGSLGIAHSYIDALAETGVNVVKFQTHIAAAESSQYEPFRVKFSYEDPTRQDYWKRMEFTIEQWRGLKSHCEEVGMEFMSSPFSLAAVELLEKIGVKRYKIGSGEMTNLLLLDRITATGKPMILSSGMSSYGELDQTIDFLKDKRAILSLLQCTTSYPCPAGDWGLSQLLKLKHRYGLPTGYSDHSGDIYAGLAAVALGAELLEFHVAFDKKMFGPDAQSSLTPSQIKKLVDGAKQIALDLGQPQDLKADNSRFSELKSIFEKSLSVNKDLHKGSVIRITDLETKKPANLGIPAKDYQRVIGKKLLRDLQQWDFLKVDDLEE